MQVIARASIVYDMRETMESSFSSKANAILCAMSSRMRSFFTRAFYLLQELARLGRLTSLLFAENHQVVVRYYIPPNEDSRVGDR